MRRAAVVLALLLLTACGAKDDETPEAAPTPTAPTSSTTEQPWQTIQGPLGRCGPQPATLSEIGLHHRVLRDGTVGSIPSVSAGRGRTVAVLLHQTDGSGLCGWLEHVPALVADPGVAVLAIDLCQYGAAECRRGVDATDAVAVAVAHARQEMHANRVVLVGTSMGGSIALVAASTLRGVDAAVDLSGPVDWPGMDQVRGGRAIDVPVLVAMAANEGPDQVGGAKRIVAHAPAGSRFLSASTGHGYDLLAPEGAEVRAWVLGG
jgi:pimeloyl-ACP methyl ester carboxylesterase